MGFSYYDDDSGYLPLTGGILTGQLTVEAPIVGKQILEIEGNGNYVGSFRFVESGGINYIESYDSFKGAGALPIKLTGRYIAAVEVSTTYNVLDDGHGNAQFTALYPQGQPFTSPAYIVPEYLGGNVGIRGLSSGPIVKWVTSSVQIRNNADSAYAPIDASAFTVNSEATNKSAILPLGSMLPEFEKLQFVEYLYQGMTEKMLGLEYAQTFAAGVTSILTNTTYSKGVNVSSLIALVGKALQEVVLELKTKGVLS